MSATRPPPSSDYHYFPGDAPATSGVATSSSGGTGVHHPTISTTTTTQSSSYTHTVVPTLRELAWPPHHEHKDAMWFMVEVVESQRRLPLLGWSGDKLLPTDRFNFADFTGETERRKEEVDRELPTDQRCAWLTNWELYYGTDEIDHYKYIGLDENRSHAKKYCRFEDDGAWEYALDFPREYTNKYDKIYHWVRRRFWRRVFILDAPMTYKVHFPPLFKMVMHTERVDIKKQQFAMKEYSEERHVSSA